MAIFKIQWRHTQTSKLQLTFAITFAFFSLILLYLDYKSILLTWYSSKAVTSFYQADLGTAQAESEKAIKKVPKYPYSYLLLAKIYGDSDDTKNAERVLLDMLKNISAKNRKAIAYAYISLANVYINAYGVNKSGELLTTARGYLDKAQEFYPDIPELSVSAGYISLVTNNIAQAKAKFSQILKSSEVMTIDSLSDLYIGLAMCYFMEENYKEAREYFQRAYVIKPRMTVLYGWYVYSLVKDIEAGNISAREITEGRNELKYRELASKMESLSKISSFKYFKDIAYSLYLALGNLFAKNALLDKAVTYFDLAISLDGTRSEAYISASSAFKKASENAHLDELAKESKIREAQRYLDRFSQAFASIKEKAIALNNAAIIVYEQIGSTKAAISYLEEAVRVETENPILFFNLGILYYKSRDFEKARQNLQRSLQLNPNQPDAKRLLDTIKTE